MIFIVSMRTSNHRNSNHWSQIGAVVADNLMMATDKLGFDIEPEMVNERPGYIGASFHHVKDDTDYEIESIQEINHRLT